MTDIDITYKLITEEGEKFTACHCTGEDFAEVELKESDCGSASLICVSRNDLAKIIEMLQSILNIMDMKGNKE